MARLLFALTVTFLMVGCSITVPDDASEAIPTINEKTAGMERFSGFVPFYWDAKQGKVWIEIDKWDTEFLYANYLTRGIGSNDIGLDRGQIGGSRIVKFQRIGPKVLMVQPNYSFRAISDNQAERKAVQESFAESIIWGFQVAAQERGRVLVDASKFFLRDAHDVTGALRLSKQGGYKLEPSRSAFNPDRAKNFPKNTEVGAILTFIGNSPGSFVKQVVPSPKAITVHQHHSFIQLPDNEYRLRKFDPRAGYFGISYMDYATTIGEPMLKRFIARHRLEKKNPDAPSSKAVEPIIYYVDRATPEPMRSALMDGAKWWNQAFEAIGYQDAFQVKVLPEDADPLDVRYNVIQWVHRSTRGWSYGDGIIDPRTGEIIKGHVTLGSLRVRQDYLIAEGLLGPYEEGHSVSPEMQNMALARLRQLSVHEVGHALGLAHNYAASTANRASVMDYPHPYVRIKDDGSIDMSKAYDVGVGKWDRVAIAYGYQDFPTGANEKEALNRILDDSISEGLIYISDQDARPTGGAHPLAHLWDNGSDAVAELDRVMNVREHVLERFSDKNIQEGTPMATLEDVLVPVYMFHRYQLEAAAKLLGGLSYTYAIRGDGQKVTDMVPPDDQRQALDALLRTIQPKALALPENLLQMIPPRPSGYPRNREHFNVRTGVTFDPLSAAESAANLTLQLLLHPERASRLIEYHARDSRFPGLIEVIDKLIESTWKSSSKTGYHAEIQRVIDNLVLHHLIVLAANETAAGQARAIAFQELDQLKVWLTRQIERENDKSQRAHRLFAISQISQFQENPTQIKTYKPVDPPAGPPIGMTD
jgi:hypothetical protein